jgi:pentafunctional AROM polypeptide
MGKKGQLSRSLNTFLTPVTHPGLAVAAAPGQVTVSQVHQTRFNIGLLSAKKFCLFGAPISQSMSPTIHNTGFATLGLPHDYFLSETSDWKYVKELMKSIDGASVTIPLKIDVLSNGVCSQVDDAAKKIGAINTLYKDDSGNVMGTNTDWIGIKRSIEQYYPKSKQPAIGIVLGAGGTSRAALYSLSQISEVSEIRIWNRTFSKAEALGKEFGVLPVADLKSLIKANENFIIVGTVPASAQSEIGLSNLFSCCTDYDFGIIVDMAYRPRVTPLLEACKHLENIRAVQGIEVLLEQGYEQFSIWTGKKAPKKDIQEQVYLRF